MSRRSERRERARSSGNSRRSLRRGEVVVVDAGRGEVDGDLIVVLRPWWCSVGVGRLLNTRCDQA